MFLKRVPFPVHWIAVGRLELYFTREFSAESKQSCFCFLLAPGLQREALCAEQVAQGTSGHVSQISVALAGQREAAQLKEGAGAR